ncbi:MAG: type VI secretion system baseplate subunit TssG [Proteobacteria bacterium]|nr:type VI secretion system baseplate subunit TssG [Pseudomonadota bacterium]
MREPADRLAWLRALQKEPYRHDFYHTLRRIECLFADKPRIGQALRPADEPVRLAQDVSMSFAPAPLAAFEPAADAPPRLVQRIFGLLGPNGPLPLHLTEYARERLLHHGDATLSRFLDLFHHRLTELFYRAWAQAQPTASLDRPAQDRFSFLVGALIGIGTPKLRERDDAGDFAKLFHAGLLAPQVRNADGLQALLSGYFRLPLRVEQFVGHWMHLPESDRTRLGAMNAGAQLGVGVVLGAKVWDRQHKFRLRIGPLSFAQYEAFLPGGKALARLVALVRQYLCFELEWDARLVLRHDEVPAMRLGRAGRLGWTTWLGRPCGRRDGDDLTLNVEEVLARGRRARRTEVSPVAMQGAQS